MFKKLEIKPIHFITTILVILLLLLHQCNRTSKLKVINQGLENKIVRIEANVEAANDSVVTYKNKNDYYINEISGYQYTVAELKGKNKRLLKEYEAALEDVAKLEKLNQLLKTEVNITQVDTIYANVENDTTLVFVDSTDYGDNNWRKFDATVNIFQRDGTLVGGLGTFDYSQNIKLYAGIQSIDGRKRISISTKYPGLTFNEIEGISLIEDEINIAKKQKRGRMSLGIGGGYGVTFTKQNLVYHGPQIGVFFIYSPKWLQF